MRGIHSVKILVTNLIKRKQNLIEATFLKYLCLYYLVYYWLDTTNISIPSAARPTHSILK